MKIKQFGIILGCGLMITSCVSKKKYTSLVRDHETTKEQLMKSDKELATFVKKHDDCQEEKAMLDAKLKNYKENTQLREDQIKSLKSQVQDLQIARDNQLKTVEELAFLSKSTSQNISATLDQLKSKDEYIKLLQKAKSKTDSINLALAVNLKGALADGINDQDIEISVDKTIVFINLSDKMLFKSGSYKLSSKANNVLGKIAKILESKPGFEIMVEGYTDNIPIKKDGIEDNWDLSVKRSTAVVRTLADKFKIDPNRLIAAGRGEYNALASNETAEGRATNRRTRIIIMPKLNEFYDLLKPENMK